MRYGYLALDGGRVFLNQLSSPLLLQHRLPSAVLLRSVEVRQNSLWPSLDRETDRETGRERDRQRERQTDRQTGRQRETDRQRERQTDRQRDRQRETDRLFN